MSKQTINPEIIKVCKSVSRYTANKWRGVITYDDALSECYMWLATPNKKGITGLQYIEDKMVKEPTRWHNTLSSSLNNQLGRLGQKEVTYYSKNNGAVEQVLQELETETQHFKDKNTFLQTKPYYNDKEKLQSLLYFMKHDPNNLDKTEWETLIPFIDYKDSQAVISELQSIYYGLTKKQQQFIIEKHIEQLSNEEMIAKNNVKPATVKDTNNNIIRLIKLKLQQTNMVW